MVQSGSSGLIVGVGDGVTGVGVAEGKATGVTVGPPSSKAWLAIVGSSGLAGSVGSGIRDDKSTHPVAKRNNVPKNKYERNLRTSYLR